MSSWAPTKTSNTSLELHGCKLVIASRFNFLPAQSSHYSWTVPIEHWAVLKLYALKEFIINLRRDTSVFIFTAFLSSLLAYKFFVIFPVFNASHSARSSFQLSFSLQLSSSLRREFFIFASFRSHPCPPLQWTEKRTKAKSAKLGEIFKEIKEQNPLLH